MDTTFLALSDVQSAKKKNITLASRNSVFVDERSTIFIDFLCPHFNFSQHDVGHTKQSLKNLSDMQIRRANGPTACGHPGQKFETCFPSSLFKSTSVGFRSHFEADIRKRELPIH